MILYCNFEELRALASGAEMVLGSAVAASGSAVAAPAETMELVELLRPRLTGDMSLTSLAEQRQVRTAVHAICEELRVHMDERIVQLSPGHEEAVNTYFDYAHSRVVLDRLDRMGSEMYAIVELITGAAPNETTAHSVTFPD
ncbi:MAG TPA: hypothetical protein VHG51_20515 [Longimicrobiaceae bacterium]|nr:hypothetical protein [Longimicrobiaceae bacterium]